MSEIAFNLPINGVSFGETSCCLLKTIFERNESKDPILLFPIGQPDLSSQQDNPEFAKWLETSIRQTPEKHSRNIPILKLWHLNDCINSFSKKQSLLTFYELDSPTPFEINSAKNQDKLIVSSNYTKKVFEDFGLNNVEFCPIGFDRWNFKRLDKVPFPDRITFNLLGKLEKRKKHRKIIQSWIKRFGGDRKYFLQCAVYNRFLVRQNPSTGQMDDFNGHALNEIFEGKRPPFNVHIMQPMSKNETYNEFLNSADIVIGMSGGEGFGLPEFQSVAIGKHAVMLNAHAYKDWATADNSVLVNPAGKEEVYDNVFFKRGLNVNQGNIYDWNADEFIHGCEEAIKKVENNRLNVEGLKLQEKFHWDGIADKLINITKGL